MRRGKVRAPGLAAAAATLQLSSPIALAQTLTSWQSGVSGSFTDPTKWSNGAPLSTAFDALIAALGSYTITVNAGTVNTGNVTVNSSGAVVNVFSTLRATR